MKANEKVKSTVKSKGVPFSSLPLSWSRPDAGIFKCNLSVLWSNAESMYGGAWIIPDSRGEVLFHMRDAFVPSASRLETELHVIEWAIQSLRDLRFKDVEV